MKLSRPMLITILRYFQSDPSGYRLAALVIVCLCSLLATCIRYVAVLELAIQPFAIDGRATDATDAATLLGWLASIAITY